LHFRLVLQYGPVKSVIMVEDKNTGKPRGYAFIEFEHERDMKTAYKHADGRKIDGRRILVDVERGRTVKDWRPRKIGGGLGSSRKNRPKKTKAEKAEAKRFEPYGGGARANGGGRRDGDKRRDEPSARGSDAPRREDRYDSRGAGGSSRDDYRSGGGSRGGDRRGGGGGASYDDYYKGSSGGGGGDRDRDRRH
jgi:U1 small nuclear ribonucleoprotein